MERYLKIASGYRVSAADIGQAAEEASRFTHDIDSEEWYTVYACALGNIEEQNNSSNKG